jgi:hypothetical protein
VEVSGICSYLHFISLLPSLHFFPPLLCYCITLHTVENSRAASVLHHVYLPIPTFFFRIFDVFRRLSLPLLLTYFLPLTSYSVALN